MRRHVGRAGLFAAIIATALLGLVGGGCKHSRVVTVDDPQQAPIVKNDRDGLLFTWIDDKGDFHVETRVLDVPIMGRDAVRVVDPGKENGSDGERVFAADLRQIRSDGTYAVRTMSRTDFEAIAVARREKAGPTLANALPPASQGTPPAEPRTETTSPVMRGPVVIYGAEWCGACHEAARYLRERGIPYVEKDVEKDPSAASEMQQKLARRGLHGGSIPVLDVHGKVIIGFNPAEVAAALGQPL
ncbi:MAG: NrdH-redoxin [Myxococcota bacterium]|nr:NrdH-redoxin [Myxococcota bacterium]